ncbi:MBL fold metallo-hydrolase [Pontibacillus salicampi]|uniref:MBL fold metallo-hydrolase n=1 Tax=Pontibacillus salicampi TaxID=1449801 RepID=A0ABV6LJU7_9BACI
MEIEQLPLGPLGTNCYLLVEGDRTLIVDPGGDAEKLIRMVERRKLTPAAILLTHAHFDHIGAVDEVRERYNIDVYVHELEKDWLMDANQNGSSFFPMATPPVTARPADYFLTEGTQTIDKFSFEVRHTPGHSPGSITFLFQEDHIAIVGDTLFQGGIGRTDLPGGDMNTLMDSIEQKILTLPGTFTVCPGHGSTTTVDEEKQSNPFLS